MLERAVVGIEADVDDPAGATPVSVALTSCSDTIRPGAVPLVDVVPDKAVHRFVAGGAEPDSPYTFKITGLKMNTPTGCLQVIQCPTTVLRKSRPWISCGSRGNSFNGTVKGVLISIADAAENSDHLVSPEERVRITMARQ